MGHGDVDRTPVVRGGQNTSGAWWFVDRTLVGRGDVDITPVGHGGVVDRTLVGHGGLWIEH